VCGVFGAVSLSAAPLRSKAAVIRSAGWLRHRGPDGVGHLQDGFALLGAWRLAILDLGSGANQPFASPDGRSWLVCNGEIYNAPTLRLRYARQGYPFRSSRGDVEPLLPLLLDGGDEALDEIDGMFALALWDGCRRRLLLARDRAGEKPLFYRLGPGELHFASEIQALLAASADTPEISPAGLSDYLTLGYCTAPRTMIAGLDKLQAGHLLIADAEGIRTRCYWNAADHARAGPPATGARLLHAFDLAVARQLRSDGPVGAFVSGGLDSSLLVSALTRQIPADQLHTYAVRFEQASYDESDWAERVCRSFGTVHRRVHAGAEALRRALDFITAQLAEPLADPAILPVHLLAAAAAADVRVVFSGEGADELFGGYPTYLGHRWAEGFRRLPRPLRAAALSAVRLLPVTTEKVALSFLARRFLEEAGRDALDRHLAWFGALGSAGAKGLAPLDADGPSTIWRRTQGIEDPIKRVMVFDLLTYLADGLLTKFDRATMLSSVEGRAPYLDRALMELALGQSADCAVGAIDTKMALKGAARSRLPPAVVRRRKRGLSVPVSEWMNGALRGEVDRLLDGARLRRQGLLDPAPVQRLLGEHREGRADHGRRLWCLFTLQRWHERWIEDPHAREWDPAGDGRSVSIVPILDHDASGTGAEPKHPE
jgi:asparagine synthase (glutamine-hydrolysing)